MPAVNNPATHAMLRLLARAPVSQLTAAAPALLQSSLPTASSSALLHTTAAAASAARPAAEPTSASGWSSNVTTLLLGLAGFGAATSAVLLGSSQADSQPGSDGSSAAPASSSSSGWSLLSTKHKQHVFFKYEKRIREMSSLEKIFDYFASEERDGIKYMAPEDLLHSIVATYPPHGSDVVRAGSLPGERPPDAVHVKATAEMNTLFQQIDVDGDKLVSFAEYLLLLALLSIPLDDITTVFRLVDTDGNGTLDAEELAGVLQLLQAKAGLTRSNPRTGRHSGHQALKLEKPAGLFVHFFGENLKGRVAVQQLVEFLQALHRQLLLLEFAHYDPTASGTIAMADAAASLVASCGVSDIDRLFDRVGSMPPELAGARLTLKEFEELAKLHTHPDVHHVVTALEFSAQLGRPMTQQEVARLLRSTLRIQLSDSVLRMLFHMFGDGEGQLDWQALIAVLRRRHVLPGHRGPSVLPSKGSKNAVSNYWDCLKRCTTSDDDSATLAAA